MSSADNTPVISHLSTEFLLWLWWTSDKGGGYFNFTTSEDDDFIPGMPEPYIESIDLWVDERIAMRSPDASKVTAVLTGSNPAITPESKVALAKGGKVIEELRLGVRIDDRESFFTLKGANLALHSVKLPCISSSEGDDGATYERLALLTELDQVISQLFCEYTQVRIGPTWEETARTINIWLNQEAKS